MLTGCLSRTLPVPRFWNGLIPLDWPAILPGNTLLRGWLYSLSGPETEAEGAIRTDHALVNNILHDM